MAPRLRLTRQDQPSSSTGGPFQEYNYTPSCRGGCLSIEQSCIPAGGTGPSAFGLTDMELGVKLAIIKETQHIPQIGTFTIFEMPTGTYYKGLGVGKI